MTMITPSYLGETIEYSSLHACRSTLEDPTARWAGREGRALILANCQDRDSRVRPIAEDSHRCARFLSR